MNKDSGFWFQLRKDKWLILFCLVLAFLGWQGIRKNIGLDFTVSNVGVEVDAPEGWAVWEKSAPSVNIKFLGSREDISYLNNEQLRVVIPMPNPEYGVETEIKLTSAHLRNPTRAKVVSFSPEIIMVRLDQEVERSLPVKATISEPPPEGLEVERHVCSPASVRVSGARQVLEAMESIHTEPIDLSNRQSSFKETTRIALPQAGRVLAEPEWVSVEFFLEARDSEATFEKIPVRVMGAPGERRRITVAPETINLTVRGRRQRVEQIRAAEIFAYVNCHDLTESTTYELPVAINLPSGIQAIKTDPQVVLVEVENSK